VIVAYSTSNAYSIKYLNVFNFTSNSFRKKKSYYMGRQYNNTVIQLNYRVIQLAPQARFGSEAFKWLPEERRN